MTIPIRTPPPDAGLDGVQYFRRCYGDYERQTSQRKLRFYLELVSAWVPAGKRLFELGVGMGHFLGMARECYACGGCDINSFAIDEARKKAPGTNLSEGSFETVPTDLPPDAIVSWDVLEHIESIDRAMEVIHKRLTDGGFLIGVVPVYDGWLGWLVHLLDHDPTHHHKWSRRQWMDLFQRSGFDIRQQGSILRRLVFRRWYLHLTRPQWLLRHIGSAWFFVGRKRAGEPNVILDHRHRHSQETINEGLGCSTGVQ